MDNRFQGYIVSLLCRWCGANVLVLLRNKKRYSMKLFNLLNNFFTVFLPLAQFLRNFPTPLISHYFDLSLFLRVIVECSIRSSKQCLFAISLAKT